MSPGRPTPSPSDSIASEPAAALPPPPGAPVVPRPVSWWKVAGLGAAGLAGCAYVAFFDPSTSSALYPACPFRAVTGLDCPGCGVTRALHSLANGDLPAALDHNVLWVVALPVLLWWMLRGFVRSRGRRPPGPSVTWRPWMTWTLVSTVLAFWLVRNLPWWPFDWLASGLS